MDLAIPAVAWSPCGNSLAISVEDRLPIDADNLLSEAEHELSEERGDEDELLRTFELSVTPPGGEPNWDRYEGAMHIRILDTASGLQIGALESGASTATPTDLVWLRDSEHLISASADGISLWHVKSGHLMSRFQESAGFSNPLLLLLPNDRVIAGGEEDEAAYVWDTTSGSLVSSVDLGDEALCASLEPGNRYVAIGTSSGVVHVFNPNMDPSRTRSLEGHAGRVTGVSFSPDGGVLATSARDGVKLWNTSDWTLLSELTGEVSEIEPGGLCFSPVDSTLAVVGPDNSDITLWAFDLPALAAKQDRPATVHYANAKVVLVGDTGVGKSGLGLVLAGEEFVATDSTHQRNIWTLSSSDTAGAEPEHREVFLWDLAGQPGYRLLHQLHLADVAVALVVFDARNELDPLAGVRYWCRALDQAARISDTDSSPMARILVAARMDRGGAKVGDDEIRQVREKFTIDDYVTTSAKEGAGIQTLKQRIDDAIDWDGLPKVSSTGLFESIRRFLVAKRATSVILTTESDLRESFAETGAAPEKDVLNEFRVCIDRLQSRGLIRRLTFGELVLLKPEVLDAYAAAVINAAANQSDGLGAIREADVRSASFLIPEDDRLADEDTEKLLLIATIEDLLKHEVALREDSSNGTYLVFPTQSTRALADGTTLRPWSTIAFEGSIAHIWATLVVRLSHSGVFVGDQVGLNFATFRGAGRTMGVRLTPTDEGAGKLELLSEQGLRSGDTELLFEGFVVAHLKRRAISRSLEIEYVVTCGKCEFRMPVQLLDAFRGQKSLRCPECAGEVKLDDEQTASDETRTRAEIARLQQSADRERARGAARTSVQGKEEVHEFDAFLAHNSHDKEAVVVISERLRDYGLNPWLDRDQIPPGRWFQDIIQEAIGRVRAAVVVIGQGGLGRWQELELRAFISQCIDRDIPVIPTLLPGAEIPGTLQPFLAELQVVEFSKSINDVRAFADLVWGITGERRDRERILKVESALGEMK